MIYLSDHTLSSSVRYGIYNGGDISIQAAVVSALDSKLSATAHEGNGGNINIYTKLFVNNNRSVVLTRVVFSFNERVDPKPNISPAFRTFDGYQSL
jgi:hypothetical protein